MAERVGLASGVVELARDFDGWRDVADELISVITGTLDGSAALVEHIGSTAVAGLAAKPIIDIAIALPRQSAIAAAVVNLVAAGFVYRDNAGDNGGHVLVLESSDGRRLANIHVVDALDPQWGAWLRFRDRLRTDVHARERYAVEKTRLAAEFPSDRIAYTDGKTKVVREILEHDGLDRLVPGT
jgi:GrpB-like predicted nucleotidyltransferase (UPF0157 family)